MRDGSDQYGLRGADVERRFAHAAACFDGADFIHRLTCDGLLARLEPLRVPARTVVDLGCATGAALPALRKRFRGALVIGADASVAMLREARAKGTLLARPRLVNATADRLPFGDQSIDLLFANLLLPWLRTPAVLFAEAARVLRRDGLLLFSTLGPDSLLQLRQAWADADPGGAHVHHFHDMHDIGDAAVRAGLRDPVLDVDRQQVSYRDAASLYRDLTAVGGRNCLAGRRGSLTGKHRFGQVTAALEAQRVEGRLRVDLELVYAHCWGPGARVSDGEIRISPGRIGRRS